MPEMRTVSSLMIDADTDLTDAVAAQRLLTEGPPTLYVAFSDDADDALDSEDEDVDNIDEIPPYRQPRALSPEPRGYKPGTRQTEKSTRVSSGERPWWASNDPALWMENQTRMKARGTSETKGIIGWAETGLSGGR